MSKDPDLSAFLKPGPDGRVRLDLAVEGIGSADAIGEIEGALRAVRGLVDARLNFTTRRLSTEWAGADGDLSSAIDILERLGFRVAPFLSDRAESEQDLQTKWLLRCLVVAGFSAVNVMLLSISVWSGNVTDMTSETRDLFHWLSALIALPAAGFAGQPFFLSAVRAVRSGAMNMDVPISIGITLALGMSVYETAHHAEHAYFDSALMLIFFLLSGRVLEQAMRKRTWAAAANLAAFRAPVSTRIEADGALSELPSEAVNPGDLILVRPGDRIPVDGDIESGASRVDDSLLTGETALKAVGPGTRVHAGMLNGAGSLTIRVAAVGSATLLSDIERLIEQAIVEKSRYVAFADRVARVYAPVVHAAAGLTAIGWILAGSSIHDALVIAIAVLIITCPCALALAAPTVQVVVAGALFRRGILMKAGDVIERMAAVDTIIFDKTGTLTLPEPTLVDTGTLSDEALCLAGRLAQSSRHPLVRALREHARDRFGPLEALADAVEETGQGVRASVDGLEVRLGSMAYCGLPPAVWREGASVIAFRHGEDAGIVTIGQSLRPDAVDVIETLRRAGYRLMIMSGDGSSAVRAAAQTLGIDVWKAGLKPDEKKSLLESLRAEGAEVLMVGDGLNDAPALAAASVSMSPATGADVAQAAADTVFTGSRLVAVADALALSVKGRRVMRENFLIALVYNLIAVPLAVAGCVTPLIAAAAMSGSSIIVTVNALRARRITEGKR